MKFKFVTYHLQLKMIDRNMFCKLIVVVDFLRILLSPNAVTTNNTSKSSSSLESELLSSSYNITVKMSLRSLLNAEKLNSINVFTLLAV